MAENTVCESLRNRLIEHQNRLLMVPAELFRARQIRDQIASGIRNMEIQVRIARIDAQISRVAPRVFGPLAGGAVAVLGGVQAEIRLSRLEGNLVSAKGELTRAVILVDALEKELDSLKHLVEITRDQLLRQNCNS